MELYVKISCISIFSVFFWVLNIIYKMRWFFSRIADSNTASDDDALTMWTWPQQACTHYDRRFITCKHMLHQLDVITCCIWSWDTGKISAFDKITFEN